VLGVVLAFAGVAVAPLFVVSYLASDDVTPAQQRTEASTWINTANNLGSSAGASVAGLGIDRVGPSWGFLCGWSAAEAGRADDPAQPPQHRRTGRAELAGRDR
jgi:predicted MFS family arabinose efflux permease